MTPDITESQLKREVATFIGQLQQVSELTVGGNLVVEDHKPREHVLPELPKAEMGKVVMRLAPYPSGPLHIGNARMVALNDEYVKKYNGKLILVYDDTIGSDEKYAISEAYDLIEDGLDWMGVKVNEIYYKSDRLPIYYDWCTKLIESHDAYVCQCATNEMQKNRREGIECRHRNQDNSANVTDWKMMLDGGFPEGTACVRLKTDMQHKNPAFRDRVLMRISEREHPRIGKKYRVWPMLEFSWAVDDYLLGITHVLRGKDLIIEDDMERYIWDKLGIKPNVYFGHFGLLSIADAKLSKSKSRAEVHGGTYDGWDDPRTWSLQSLRTRGIHPDAVRKFVLSFGLSLTEVMVPATNLYAENRKLYIDIPTITWNSQLYTTKMTVMLPSGERVVGYIEKPVTGIVRIKGFGYVNIVKQIFTPRGIESYAYYAHE